MGDLLKSVTTAMQAGVREDMQAAKSIPANQVPLRPSMPAKTEQAAKPKFNPEQQREAMQEMIERLNQMVKDTRRDLHFSLDERINKFIIVVKNTNSGEVVRQIPSEAAVKMAHSIEDMKGIIFNEEL